MTESVWLASSDVVAMLSYLQESARASIRKPRLFACACCRSIWHRIDRERCRKMVLVSEQFADGLATKKALSVERKCLAVTGTPARLAANRATSPTPWSCATETSILALQGSADEALRQAALVRDIFGNPFRPAPIDSAWIAWNDGTVVKLAQAIYDERELPSGHLDAGRLAILADALEEGDCANADMLAHCRSPGPHVRGCWVVDLLLGKE